MAKKVVIPFTLRKAADVATAVSTAYAPFGAAVAYRAAAAAAPNIATALAFALGYGVLLLMLPFSVYALVFLSIRRRPHQTRGSILACVVAAPAALLAAVLAVLSLGNVALAAAVAWAADVFAAKALGWCLTNGGYTAVAFSRRKQYANYMDAVDRTPELAFPLFYDDFGVARRNAVRFAVALSAACAVAGGAAVGILSGSGGGSAFSSGAMAATAVFALPMCLVCVPEYLMDPYPTIDGVLQRNPMAAWCALLAPAGLVLCRLVKAVATAAASTGGGSGTLFASAAGVFWAMDAGAAVLVGRVIAREIAKPSIFRSTSTEIVSAFLMVCLRYFVYLHVFHFIACGGHPTWFNSP